MKSDGGGVKFEKKMEIVCMVRKANDPRLKNLIRKPASR